MKCTGFYGTPDKVDAQVHVVFLPEEQELATKVARSLPPPVRDTIGQLKESVDFSGKTDEVLHLLSPAGKFVIVGLGMKGTLTLETLRRAAAKGMREAKKFTGGIVAVHCPAEELFKRQYHLGFDDLIQSLVEGALLSMYSFDRYLSKNPTPSLKGVFKEIRFTMADEGYQSRLKAAIETAVLIVEGVTLARNLANMPANDLTPEALAQEAVAMAQKNGIKALVLGRKEIEAHKMGGLLAVNRGSRNDPRFIVLEYNETKKRLPLYAVVGKGVTFDSGGISIKPAQNMDEMKMDMSGAAAVVGLMYTVAKLKLPIRVVGLIPATDNMSGGGALCPGDIIRISNGKTVEVINTDAEGRLILADALVYAQRFKPTAIIDLATLTGACVVALAQHASGMMGTGTEVKDGLKKAGDKTFERVWELPLYEEFEEMMKSTIADLKNLGIRWGGAITAAAFLKAFVGDYPWVHLDIAGTAIVEDATDYIPKGGSGVGVRLLTEYFRSIKPQA